MGSNKKTKKKKTVQPHLRVPPDCVLQLKPLLYELAVLKGRGASVNEVTSYTTDNIMPVFHAHNLGDVSAFPDMYPADWDSKRAIAVRSPYRPRSCH